MNPEGVNIKPSFVKEKGIFEKILVFPVNQMKNYLIITFDLFNKGVNVCFWPNEDMSLFDPKRTFKI